MSTRSGPGGEQIKRTHDATARRDVIHVEHEHAVAVALSRLKPDGVTTAP